MIEGAPKSGILFLGAPRPTVELNYYNFKIRLNSISPGYINDGMSKDSFMDKKKNKKRLQRMILKRWGTPEDLFGIVEYLFSSNSSYVTGQDFVIDGGWISKGL